MPRNNRTAGHDYERQVVNELKDIGYIHATSTRLESRSRDNKKIDVMNKNEHINGRLPYNFQCKCMTDVPHTSTKAERVLYKRILNEMEIEEGLMNVVLHKHTVKPPGGKKFVTKGEYAFMHKRDLFLLLADLLKCQQKIKEYESNEHATSPN